MNLLDTLASETGISRRDVHRIIASAPKRYKSFTIPKRDGRERLIAQPAFELKVIQRVLTSFLSSLPVHDAAYAYVKGRSIRQNALKHVKSEYLMKLDFSDFFPSIRPVDLERVLHKNANAISVNDFQLVYQACFWGKGGYNPSCLSIGAPSSPLISNIVMFDIDREATHIADQLGLIYTRYADDITVSTRGGQASLLTFEQRLRKLIAAGPLALTFNEGKRGIYGRGERRMVTGLVITPDGLVSIGRERKRLIRAAVNQLRKNPNDRLLMRCKGYLAFVISAEPRFLHSMIRSYGATFIRSILRSENISFYPDISALDLN